MTKIAPVKNFIPKQILEAVDKALDQGKVIGWRADRACIKYADNFIKKFSGTVKTYGGTITKKYADVNVNNHLGGIFVNGHSVSDLGNHAIVEIVVDGKTFVTDNMNKLMLKDDYIKFLEVDVFNPETKLMDTFKGEAAYKFFK